MLPLSSVQFAKGWICVSDNDIIWCHFPRRYDFILCFWTVDAEVFHSIIYLIPFQFHLSIKPDLLSIFPYNDRSLPTINDLAPEIYAMSIKEMNKPLREKTFNFNTQNWVYTNKNAVALLKLPCKMLNRYFSNFQKTKPYRRSLFDAHGAFTVPKYEVFILKIFFLYDLTPCARSK